MTMLASATIITLSELACIEDAGCRSSSLVSRANDHKNISSVVSLPLRNKFIRCHGKFVLDVVLYSHSIDIYIYINLLKG